MRRSGDFASVVRTGARIRRGCLVVHIEPGLYADAPAKVGLVVSKSVGGSVVRHRVSRRLRGQLAARLPALPEGSGVVVRALPDAATATSARLGADLDAALARLVTTRPRPPRAANPVRGSQLRAGGPSQRAGDPQRTSVPRDAGGEAR